MDVKAYVLIRMSSGVDVKKVLQVVKSWGGTCCKNVEPLEGNYSFMATFEARTDTELRHALRWQERMPIAVECSVYMVIPATIFEHL